MNKGSREKEATQPVGNDNDQDRDFETQDEDREEGEITQRNPRQGDQSQQGQQKVDRGGQMDRDEGDRDPRRE